MEARKDFFLTKQKRAGEKAHWELIQKTNSDLLAPMLQTGLAYYLVVAILALLVVAGAAAWTYQIQTGIGQSGLHPPIFWGIYIASFVFWVGVSHSGTFISGVLRISKAEWRRPITRIAELMTLFSVIVAALFIFVHLGRVWRFYYLIPYPNQREIWPNFRSPLMWDAAAIFTYATSSLIYLYIPLIPDFALMRDRVTGWRRPFYRILSLGWRGTQTEWRWLGMAIRIITILIVMVMISVHSIVGFDFAVSLVPGWHSTIIPPYFVVGAIHSGMATVVMGLYLLRKTYRLHDYIRLEHFDKMGKLMLVITLLWGYFYYVERHVVWFGGIPDEMTVLDAILYGSYAPQHWVMILFNFLIPLVALSIPRFRRWPLGLLVIGVMINIAMYIERILIIVPSLAHPRLEYAWGRYFPSWVELTILVGSFAFFLLLYVLAIKFVPMISIWEEKEGILHGRHEER
ncbi:NrfD/PsrC family molybdoenzyme membrane anchor subunit [Candidatus Manganitrophus noduliformans]|uniref:Polysulfide reductase n=1 Tax=Candidatus Manganitrophus noduliformans TaxID=2606439 RepID=A0A7X6DPL6_9BACT|nr:NrfD/PsrC family molybdoenzyme membrane anchor subunit [Candidatus Manganitrophus noduliformans]NKE70758.1 polysulfide reductase [Candidatus Manganitrophus noduliformans]